MHKNDIFNIYLVGFRCTGKTSVAKILSTLSSRIFLDTDQALQEKMDKSISEMVAIHGWDYFRTLEKKLFHEISLVSGHVVSTGGGIVLDTDNRELLKKTGKTVWLTAGEEVILERMQADPITDSSRPSLTRKEMKTEIRELIQSRNPFYRETSCFDVDTTFLTPVQVAQTIMRRLFHDRL